MTPIYDLPISKLLIILRKLHNELLVNNNDVYLITYGTEKINQQLRMFGYDYISIKEYSFIVEFMRLNNENFRLGTLTKENVILPKLKKVAVEHIIIETDVIEKTWEIIVETFSTERAVCGQFFDGGYNRASDAIDIYNIDPDYERVRDTDVGDVITKVKEVGNE